MSLKDDERPILMPLARLTTQLLKHSDLDVDEIAAAFFTSVDHPEVKMEYDKLSESSKSALKLGFGLGMALAHAEIKRTTSGETTGNQSDSKWPKRS